VTGVGRRDALRRADIPGQINRQIDRKKLAASQRRRDTAEERIMRMKRLWALGSGL
jgi:hypothetical protein